MLNEESMRLLFIKYKCRKGNISQFLFHIMITKLSHDPMAKDNLWDLYYLC